MANPFVHIELSTDDTGKAIAFYKKIFAWKLQDMPMGPGMTYTMLDVGKGTGGGIQPMHTPGMQSQWLAYVEVDSVKDTIAKAKKAGGQILVAYQPIPNMGAFGVFVDPTGAPLGVWEMTQKPAAKKAGKKKAKKVAAKTTTKKKVAAKKKTKKK